MNLTTFLTTLIVLTVVAVAAYIVGRRTAPKPAPPEPKSFGLAEAETLAAQIGGLTTEKGQVVKLSALVAGLNFTVPREAEEEASFMAFQAATQAKKSEEFRAAAKRYDEASAASTARASEIDNLAANFV